MFEVLLPSLFVLVVTSIYPNFCKFLIALSNEEILIPDFSAKVFRLGRQIRVLLFAYLQRASNAPNSKTFKRASSIAWFAIIVNDVFTSPINYHPSIKMIKN